MGRSCDLPEDVEMILPFVVDTDNSNDYVVSFRGTKGAIQGILG